MRRFVSRLGSEFHLYSLLTERTHVFTPPLALCVSRTPLHKTPRAICALEKLTWNAASNPEFPHQLSRKTEPKIHWIDGLAS
jgi:hypothetical protein